MTIRNNGQRFIFVGGAPRSGTTLVQNMLDCHPLVLGGPEFLHLERIIELREKLHFSVDIGYIDIICTKDDIDFHLRQLIEKLLLPLADKNECQFYSEKTPNNILIFSELMEMFPESRFIMIVRDPRAIVSSMQQVKQRAIEKDLKQPYFTKSISSSIEFVKKCYDAGFKASNKSKGNLLIVAYEHLLSDLENQTKKIASFLNIEWDKQMLYPADKKHLGEKAITKNSGEIWYDVKAYYRNPDKKNIEKWQNKLTPRQKVRVTMAFEKDPNFTQFEYDFSLSSLKLENDKLAKIYYIYLHLKNFIFRLFIAFARKIPGISFAKRKILAVLRSF
jgi:hypothetical protein